jgi:hypothetical protein
MPSAWAGAGLTSAGVDPTVGNNNAQDEPTLAQVAPTANQSGIVSSGPNAAVPTSAVAGTAGAAGANGPQAANAAADGSKPAAAVAVAPAPPPPPPDPSTLPVSVIRPVNKSGETATPKSDDESAATTMASKPGRRVPADTPAEPTPVPARAPTPALARAPQPAPAARAEPPRTAVNAAPASTTPTSATADGSANGFVFYTGMGIAGIILALSFFGFMRAGNDSGRPRA